jgi:CubicO group peptidase (beta-lactamase class C family)
MKRVSLLSLIFFVSNFGFSAERSLKDFEASIEQIMKDWQVPGVALAIVKDNEVFFKKGFGWRDLEKKLPVTTNTVFPIASLTKAFTTALMGMLADEGKLEWDKPVQHYLANFDLYDKEKGHIGVDFLDMMESGIIQIGLRKIFFKLSLF